MNKRVRTCRKCGCTDLDCRGCIARTGKPCHWVETDLCSACIDQPAVIDDRKRLDYLEELIRVCPHAQVSFADEGESELPAHFFIRIESCDISKSVGKTLRDAIDADMRQHGYDE